MSGGTSDVNIEIGGIGDVNIEVGGIGVEPDIAYDRSELDPRKHNVIPEKF